MITINITLVDLHHNPIDCDLDIRKAEIHFCSGLSNDGLFYGVIPYEDYSFLINKSIEIVITTKNLKSSVNYYEVLTEDLTLTLQVSII